jgi:drug/metabolite transporter (DMT)-like permease
VTPARALLQLHLAALLYGLSALFGQALSVSPEMIVFARGLFALAVLVPLCLLVRRPPWCSLRLPDIGKLMALGVALAVHWLLFFEAIHTGGVAVATLGFATFPAFTAISGRLLFGQHMSGRDWALIGLASAGLVLIGPLDASDTPSLTGLAWGVASGATYAAIAIANQRLRVTSDSFTSSAWQMAGIVLALAPLSWGEWPQVSAKDWCLLAGLGVLCTGVAYTLFVGGLSQVSANIAAVVIALEPVYAIAGAWLVFQHRPTWTMALGGGLIVGAVAWAGWRRRPAG